MSLPFWLLCGVIVGCQGTGSSGGVTAADIVRAHQRASDIHSIEETRNRSDGRSVTNDAQVPVDVTEQPVSDVSEASDTQLDSQDVSPDSSRPGPLDVQAIDADQTPQEVTSDSQSNVEPTCGSCVAPEVWTSMAVVTGVRSHIDFVRHDEGRYLAYQTYSEQLSVAVEVGGSWETFLADDGVKVGSNVSVAVDAQGAFHASYIDLQNTSLKYANNVDGVIQTTVVDQGAVGFFSSIAIDAVGGLHVAYRDTKSYSVEYASCDAMCDTPGSWAIETVDANGTTGKFNSLAITSNGVPAVTYHEESESAIRAATRNLDGWLVETIATGPGVGWLTSLVAGPDDGLNVSYIDTGAKQLMFAASKGGQWSTQAVAKAQLTTFMGQGQELAVDAENRIHLAWSDDTQTGLQYAWCPMRCGAICCEGQWNAVVVDPMAAQGQDVSIALHSDGRAEIAYVAGFGPATKIQLVTAKCAETGCDVDD